MYSSKLNTYVPHVNTSKINKPSAFYFIQDISPYRDSRFDIQYFVISASHTLSCRSK